MNTTLAETGSNTNPDTEPKPSSVVLLRGLDTLELTIGGVSSPSSWLRDQEEVWRDYQDNYEIGDDYVSILIGEYWFSLFPFGSQPYKFQLRNPEIGFIKVWSPSKWSSGVEGKQQIHLKLYSKYLHSISPSQLVSKVKELVSPLVENVDECFIQVSRVDVHTDVSRDKMLSYDECSNTITRSKVRRKHFEDTDVKLTKDELDFLSNPPPYKKGVGNGMTDNLKRKLLQLYNNQVRVGVDSLIEKRELETCYYGKLGGNIWGKVYNKTKEVEKKLDDDTPKLWKEGGWNGEDVVIRVEFSMKRKFLKQLDEEKYVSLDGFLSGIDKVWEYLTHNWLRMVENVMVNNYHTSIISKFWLIVQGSFNQVEEKLIRKKLYKGRCSQLWSQGMGCIKQYLSLGMNNNEDVSFKYSVLMSVDNVLTTFMDTGEYLKRRRVLGVG